MPPSSTMPRHTRRLARMASALRAADVRAPLSSAGVGSAAVGAAGVAGGSSFALEECTIESIQSALKAGSLTCVQLVELYLARIKAFNGQSVRYGTPADPPPSTSASASDTAVVSQARVGY